MQILIILNGNFLLLLFLSRRNVYKLIKQHIPEIIEDLYSGDCEKSEVFSTLSNILLFWINVFVGFFWGFQSHLYLLPFIVWILAKLWTKRLIKNKIRIYVIKSLFKDNIGIANQEFDKKFMDRFTKLMKLIYKNFRISADDFPIDIEIKEAAQECIQDYAKKNGGDTT